VVVKNHGLKRVVVVLVPVLLVLLYGLAVVNVFGPKSNRNYDLKVNKKQKRIALEFALNELSEAGKLFIVDNIEVESGKTKDADAIFKALDVRDALFVKEIIDEKTFMAFRNLQTCYLVEGNELNAFLAATYRSVVMEKAVFEQIVEGAK